MTFILTERKTSKASAAVRLITSTALCFVCGLAVVCALYTSAAAAPNKAAQGFRVEGVVVDQSGSPVADAQVSLKVATSTIGETRTDVNGQFIINTGPATTGVVVVRARGFATAEQTWSVGERASAGLKIVLLPASISEQVTVTATRTETRLGDNPSSVVILSSAELSNTAATTLDDALRQVPGFQLFRRSGSRTANPTSQGVSLRGVGASGASRALVLADGIPMNDPFGGWVYWGRVARGSVERVEVLRGGASNLYGSSALGGVVHVITQKAAHPAASFEASYGNGRTPDATLFAGGSKGRWNVALAAGLFSTDGYVLVAQSERGRIDTPAGSRHATLDLTLGRQLAGTGRVFVRGALFGESRTNGTPLQTNRTRIRQLSAGLDWQSKTAGTITLRAYGGSQVFDQNFSAVSSDRESETLTRVQRVPAQVWGFSAQWSRAVGNSHTLVAGLDGRAVRGASDEIVFAQGSPSSLVGAGGRELTVGVFAEDIFRLTTRLLVTGSARFDRWSNYRALSASRSLRQNAPAASNLFPDRTETAFSPKLSALYRVGERVSLTASAYRAFRQPTLNELYRSFRVGDVLTQANERLSAERLTGGEAGVSVTPLNRRFNLRGAFYWTEITRPVANVTLNVTPTLITRQRQNLGRTRSRGVEIESEARFGERWTISGGYLFADASVLRFPANRVLEGLLIPQVARHQLTLQMRYAHPTLVNVSLQARATGAQFDDDQNRFRLDRYFTLDAFASRQLARNIELFVAVENLLNQRYEIGRTPVTTLSPPLLARVGFRLRLGSH
jgi:outer membrane receptor protein involved in Fe transport